jgi:hypothetical protein
MSTRANVSFEDGDIGEPDLRRLLDKDGTYA